MESIGERNSRGQLTKKKSKFLCKANNYRGWRMSDVLRGEEDEEENDFDLDKLLWTPEHASLEAEVLQPFLM